MPERSATHAQRSHRSHRSHRCTVRCTINQCTINCLTLLVFLGFLTLGLALHPQQGFCQSDANRILWQLTFDSSLSSAAKDEVQTTMLRTLSRASERHFIGDKIISQKIKKEGLNFPACFTQGIPCPANDAIMLDVHNVDAYAAAHFSRPNGQWRIDLKLYRSMTALPVDIARSGDNLANLIQAVAASLFEMESVLEISSLTPETEVYVNQKYVGHPPIAMKLPEGSQTVQFKKAGYVAQTWEFTSEKGKVYTKEIELIPEEVQLTMLVTDPQSAISIDDAPWGMGSETHSILPGDHKIKVESPNYHPFEMNYKVYPGNPQTVSIAQLPNSEDPYSIRRRGIQKYRFSLQLGYHMAHQSLAMNNAKIEVDDAIYAPEDRQWADTFFHGISLSANYENKYWGISLFRLDIGGSSVSNTFELVPEIASDNIMTASDGGYFIGFYPLQIKAHIPFWVMQAEAAFGVGLSHIGIKTKSSGELWKQYTLARTAFSLNFNIGLKYFFSEESFIYASYDLQNDFEPNSGKSSIRHGMTLGFGLQLPMFMRDLSPAPSEQPELAAPEDTAENADNTVNITDVQTEYHIEDDLKVPEGAE